MTNTLDINLEELSTSGSYSNSTSSSTLLFPSTASTETSTHQEARSKMDDESYISRTSTSIRGGSSQPRLPSRPLRIGTDRDGFPTSATPIPTESGPHRQIDLDVSIINTGPHNGTLYIQDPPSSLNEGNLMFRPSEDDPKTAMIIWEKGNRTFVQKVTDALTGGGHEITYVCDGQRLAQPLLLDRSDAHVVGLGDVARRARGQGGRSKVYNVCAVDVGRPFKSSLVSIMASNSTELPPKFRICPQKDTPANVQGAEAFEKISFSLWRWA